MKRSLERQIIASLIVILLALTPNSTAHSQSPDFGELDFVQFLLIWTGDYRGMVDGILGPQTEKAVQAYFVRRFGQHPQDIAEQHIQALIEDASEKIGVSGFRLRRDTKLDVTFGVPESIMRPSAIHDASRLLFRSLDQTVEMEVADLQNKYASLDVLYRKLTSIRGRTISYSTFRPDWFVLSGTDRDRQFYVRYHGQGSRIRGFSISFVPARAEELEPIIVAMSNVFRPSARASDPLIAFIDNVETELNDSPAPQPPSVPPGPVVVEGKQFLSHHEIGSALSGVVLDGIYPDGRSFSETYFKDGRIRYFDAMGSESGRWSIDGDTFCTSYGAHKRACFFVEREEANCFNFYVAMKESGGILKRSKDWIARGWSREFDATCKTSRPQTDERAPDEQGETFSGSGFMISHEGTIVTNAHVVDECKTLDVAGFGEATLLDKDTERDLAVLRIAEPKPKSMATIQLQPPELGQQVVVLGYPLSVLMGNALSVTTGFVSSLSGLGGDQTTYTLSANIQPGNSGGPVLDMQGNIVGVAFSKLDEVKMLEAAGTTGGNIGFAVRTKPLMEFLGPFKTETTGSHSNDELSVQAVAARGKGFTVQIICRN